MSSGTVAISIKIDQKTALLQVCQRCGRPRGRRKWTTNRQWWRWWQWWL